jgi:hypothetical protein
MMNRTRMGLGAVALAAGLLALASLNSRADNNSTTWDVPPGGLDDLVKDDTKVVTDTLNAAELKKPAIKKARVATMMLGIYAEAGKKPALQGQAAKVLEALMKEDGVADAKAAAAGLSKPAGGAAKMDWVKALWDEDNKDYDKDLAMQLFKSTRAGGLGYEKKVKDFSEKTPAGKDLTDIATMANKTVMIAQVLQKIAPTKAGDAKKTPEAWTKFAKDLQAAAADTAKAAGKKDGAATKAAIGKMDKACVNCHEVFKP